MKEKLYLLLVKEKTSRREFLSFCGKVFWGVILAQLFPLKFSHPANTAKIRKRFTIPWKPFRREELYRNHKLAG